MKASEAAIVQDALKLLQEIAEGQAPDFAIEINAEGTSVIDEDGSYLCKDATPAETVATIREL